MREELKKLAGERWTFRGVFARFGKKQYRDHPVVTTVLLRDIQDVTGRVVIDHLWFNLTKEFAALDLKPGDRIEFDARAKMYRKRNPDAFFRDDEARFVLDYKLSNPTKIKRLVEGQQIEDLPLFKNLAQ